MPEERRVGPWILFYLLTGGILLLLAGLFYPTAAVLRELGTRTGQGPAILIPLSFLLLSFLAAFVKAWRLGRRGRWVAAYGWLMGSSALAVLLLYAYLNAMTGG